MRYFIMLLAVAMLALSPRRGHSQQYPPPQPSAAPQFYGSPNQFDVSPELYAAQQAAMAGYGQSVLAQPNYSAMPAEDTYCGDGTCGNCAHCRHGHDIFGSVEFLMWWAKGTVTPALVTTSPQGTPQVDAGVLPEAEVLFGQDYLGKGLQAGGRATMGVWLDPDHNIGAACRVYGTTGDREQFSRSSLGDPILARPFYNVLLDQDDALLIAFDNGPINIVDGSISAEFTNQNFWAAESYLQVMMHRDQRRRVDLVAGYQYTRLDDRLTIDSTHTLRQLFDTEIDIRDEFATRNTFHGGIIGLSSQMANGCWAIDCLAKVALGVGQQDVSINGTTAINGVLQPPGGFLAEETNIGTYTRDKFVAIPEFTANLRYYVNHNLSFHLGYTLLFWSSVVTSGDQIDTGINPSGLFGGNIIGEERPLFEYRDMAYWVQGMNFGMSWNY
jgi:hypothetical protein